MLGSAVGRGYGDASTPLMVYFVKAGPGQGVVQAVEEVVWERSEAGLHCIVGGLVHEGISWLSTSVENLEAGFRSQLRLSGTSGTTGPK